ncbi:MAG: hypothetical protein ABEL97_11555 [Salinibacter sp.]
MPGRVGVAQAFVLFVVGIRPKLQGPIPDVPGVPEDFGENRLLLIGRVEPILEAFLSSHGVYINTDSSCKLRGSINSFSLRSARRVPEPTGSYPAPKGASFTGPSRAHPHTIIIRLICLMQMVPTETYVLTALLFTAGLFLGAVPAHPAYGQSAAVLQRNPAAPAENDSFIRSGAGYFAAGSHFPGLQLPGRGTARFFSVGGSGYGVVGGHLLIGGAGHRLFASGGGFERGGASADARYGLFTVGYLFRPASPLYVYPQVGFGAGNLDVEIEEDAQRFDGSLDDPGQGASYERRAFLFRLGGGLEYRVGTSGGGSLLVGLEAGYLFSAGESVDTNGNFARGLDASLQGPFVRLTFGGGS